MKILITGGLGYIGSHTCVELLGSGHDVAILDNLSNSDRDVVTQIQEITGRKVTFFEGDIRDKEFLCAVFANCEPEAVIHLAGLKAVGESVAQPLRYYEWNVAGSIVLLQVMAQAGVKKLIFSSSATVYGNPSSVPIAEDAIIAPTNPYGHSKAMIEQILSDMVAGDSSWHIAMLRYFNPVGAHCSGLIGERPVGIPNNLMPYISQVAVGRLRELKIFGDDYLTPDGTGVRDYIHVVDLAKGHLAALGWLVRSPTPPAAALYQQLGDESNFGDSLCTINLGTGCGYSVLEVVSAFEKVSGKVVPYRIVERRSGDVAQCYADVTKAKSLLGWKAEFGLEQMCSDAWRWQSRNVNSQ